MVVDPNPYFAKYYNENRKDFPNICSEELYVTTGKHTLQEEEEEVFCVTHLYT